MNEREGRHRTNPQRKENLGSYFHDFCCVDEILATFVLSDCLRFETFEDGNIIVLRHTEGD